MTLARDVKRLGQLAQRIERLHAQWMDAVRERDDLVTDMMLSEVLTGAEIGRAAGLSQPRTSQIKAATLKRREAEAAEARKAARRAARRKPQVAAAVA